MAADIVHLRAAVHTKVVVDGVVGAAVVVVYSTAVRGSVRHDEIVMDLGDRRHGRGLARPNGRDERLAVPCIDRAMISRLVTSLKQQILTDFVPATCAPQRGH